MNFIKGIQMSTKVIYKGIYCEVSILKISKEKYNQYKENGLPSENKDAIEWEKLHSKLSSNSDYFGAMQHTESCNFYIEKDGLITDNLKESHLIELGNITLPTRSTVEDEKKNFIVEIRLTNNFQYYLDIDEAFESQKLLISIKPERLPSGQIFDFIMMEYAGKLFSYGHAGHHTDKSTQYFLVSNKGEILSLHDESPNQNSNIKAEEKKPSAWHSAEVTPEEFSEYEVELQGGAVWPMPSIYNAKWNGKVWKDLSGKVLNIKQWRKLSA
jgi:hypothetical protein